jgi:hypothetical protein
VAPVDHVLAFDHESPEGLLACKRSTVPRRLATNTILFPNGVTFLFRLCSTANRLSFLVGCLGDRTLRFCTAYPALLVAKSVSLFCYATLFFRYLGLSNSCSLSTLSVSCLRTLFLRSGHISSTNSFALGLASSPSCFAVQGRRARHWGLQWLGSTLSSGIGCTKRRRCSAGSSSSVLPSWSTVDGSTETSATGEAEQLASDPRQQVPQR